MFSKISMHAKIYIYPKDHNSFEAVILVYQVNSIHFLYAVQMYIIMQYVYYYIIDCNGFEKDKIFYCVNIHVNP